ncbi:MAG: DUF4389 domain-containing protein, partial [Gammaproteobacteria bacterium]|nr:DUF4389 domain-containing protein [Gammaproteobacteria bacterium]
MNDEMQDNLSDRETWIRLLYSLLFGTIYLMLKLVVLAVVLMQYGFVLFSGEKNQPLLHFGDQLSHYIFQILRFVTFNSETKPFPFADWPGNELERAE